MQNTFAKQQYRAALKVYSGQYRRLYRDRLYRTTKKITLKRTLARKIIHKYTRLHSRVYQWLRCAGARGRKARGEGR